MKETVSIDEVKTLLHKLQQSINRKTKETKEINEYKDIFDALLPNNGILWKENDIKNNDGTIIGQRKIAVFLCPERQIEATYAQYKEAPGINHIVRILQYTDNNNPITKDDLNYLKTYAHQFIATDKAYIKEFGKDNIVHAIPINKVREN